MSRYIILVLAAVGIISIGVFLYFEISELWKNFSECYGYWKRNVDNKDRPEYSLKAYRELGGKFKGTCFEECVPQIAEHYVKLKYRDWQILHKEYVKKKAQDLKREHDEKILKKRIEIAEDVRKLEE